MKLKYSTIGVMAGSSMDGLDIANVELSKQDSNWSFKIITSKTIAYPSDLFLKLVQSPTTSLSEQKKLDIVFGEWIAFQVNDLIAENNLKIDLISVHGHTIIHKPDKKISWQLGSGEVIAKKTQLTTISDLRSMDISLGGQGAPLVPYGDFHLFEKYDACLNLGGIANISVRDQLTAWDICPCNQVLNFYAYQLGEDFDLDGKMSRRGTLNSEFIKSLESIAFFNKNPPKSLPNKFIDEQALKKVSSLDGLRSYTEFIANQVARDLSKYLFHNPRILITGGGAHNLFLIERIKASLPNWSVEIPNNSTINFKESIVFAFLGILRLRNEINVLKSVTGASKDSSSGVIHFMK